MIGAALRVVFEISTLPVRPPHRAGPSGYSTISTNDGNMDAYLILHYQFFRGQVTQCDYLWV